MITTNKSLVTIIFYTISALVIAMSTEADDLSCTSEEYIYLIGNMNVRESSSVSSEKIQVARKENIYKVVSSIQEEDYCWIEIGDGYIAKTGYVKEGVEGLLPEIIGKDLYVKILTNRLVNFLKKNVEIISYISKHASRINITTHYKCELGLGAWVEWYNPEDIYICEDIIARPFVFPSISLILHEACHLNQIQEGRMNWRNVDLMEKECYQMEVDKMSPLAGRSNRSFITERRCLARNYKNPRICL